jgi:hypothetical protein
VPRFPQYGYRQLSVGVLSMWSTTSTGYRTEQDATVALRRQVPLQRFTPLDRLIVARTQPVDGISGDVRVTADPTRSGLGQSASNRWRPG